MLTGCSRLSLEIALSSDKSALSTPPQPLPRRQSWAPLPDAVAAEPQGLVRDVGMVVVVPSLRVWPGGEAGQLERGVWDPVISLTLNRGVWSPRNSWEEQDLLW